MNVRHISLLALSLAVAASAQAASHRLAYSKAENVAPGGHLFVGHSESLSGITHGFGYVQPSVYVK